MQFYVILLMNRADIARVGAGIVGLAQLMWKRSRVFRVVGFERNEQVPVRRPRPYNLFRAALICTCPPRAGKRFAIAVQIVTGIIHLHAATVDS